MGMLEIHRMKSLLIVAVPRSGSTALEKACAKGLHRLGFSSNGEVLNRGYHKKLKIKQYAKKENHFEQLKIRCSKFDKSAIIRDVVQPHFIVHNIGWLLEQFNMICLLRPIDEIMASRKRLGWKMPRKTVLRYQNMLQEVPETDCYVYLDYYDFIRDRPDKLVKLLKRWYPACPKFDYMDVAFRSKRTRTFLSLEKAGITVKEPRK